MDKTHFCTQLYTNAPISPSKRLSNSAITLFLLALVSACGGSGSSNRSPSPVTETSSSSISSNRTWTPNVFVAASTYKNLCAKPRSGASPVTGEAYVDKPGNSFDEKNWLRSMSNETYLWYNEILDVTPYSTESPIDYFKKLKTFALTANNTAKDKYHYTEVTAEVEARYISGQTYGYGLGLFGYSWTPPRDIRIAYVEPNSPAANAGIKRGGKILAVDGVDLVSDSSKTGVATLNAALFPPNINEAHTIRIQEANGVTTYTVQSSLVTQSPVLMYKTLQTNSGKVGYIVFNTHIQTSESQMVDAINSLKASGAKELILDLRYNGGGLLSIASEVGYMIAGLKTSNKIFEQLQYNNKQPLLTPIPFLSAGIYGTTKNVQLPTLNLDRVFILSSSSTCSASESIINGLRGIDVEVILIGNQTCGKPYGFNPQDNCGTTYSTINFSGINAKGYGDYGDGFIPNDLDNGLDKIKGCKAYDDFNHSLGDVNEKQLATALTYLATGSCGATTATTQIRLQKATPILNNESGAILNIHEITDKIIMQ